MPVSDAMTATLEELRNRAIDQAAKTGTLDDIAQAITVAKTVAEERKSNEDLTAARRTLRSSQIQIIIMGVTAIISVLGLVATSFYNIAQISATRERIETTEWRDLLSSLDNPHANIAESLTVPFRLRSFANSARYSQDARLIAAAVISKVADINGFRQLFNFIFADQHANDLGTMTAIENQLYYSFLKNSTACEELSKHFSFPAESYRNLCWDGYTDKQVQDFGLKIDSPDIWPDIWTMRKTYRQQAAEMTFISSQIGGALRSTPAMNRHGLKITNSYLTAADFSDVDFSQLDISGTIFNEIVLTRAVLQPAKFDDTSFIASNWWDAAMSEKQFLRKLITTAFPSKRQKFFPVRRPTRLEYVSAVLALCHKADLTCTESQIPYEEDETRNQD
jgi:hypothetical protein